MFMFDFLKKRKKKSYNNRVKSFLKQRVILILFKIKNLKIVFFFLGSNSILIKLIKLNF